MTRKKRSKYQVDLVRRPALKSPNSERFGAHKLRLLPDVPHEADMEKKMANRRKGKKLMQKPLPQVLNLSRKGPNQPDLVKVIAALRDDE